MSDSDKSIGFTGRLGFILAMAGSAVGLGNLWRFPYLAAEYGGGAFILTYVILAITFGFSLMVAEVCIGRRTGKSCFEAFGSIDKRWRFIGWLAALVPAIIVPYYCVIGGWVTKYFVEYTIGNGDAVNGTFFIGFISSNLPGVFDNPMTWFLVFVALVVIVVLGGIQKGIERVSKILMPALFIMLIGITIFSFTLDGIGEGLEYYLIPHIEDISAKTILAAVGQLFYSMSLAMGITITYGAYMKKDVNVEKSARNVSMIDTGAALLAGLLIVPTVVAVGIPIKSGPTLMFVSLPEVFAAMPAGNFIAAVFFLLVIFAALTSAISLMEALVYVLTEKANMSRYVASAIVTALIVGLGTLSCLGFGPLDHITFLTEEQTFLDFFDFISNNILMPIVAILTCIFIGFVVGTKFITDEVESSGQFKAKKMFEIMIKWVCPIGLALVLATGLMDILGIMKL